jgi:hypothetical protein
MTGEEAREAFYCDICGYSHAGPCSDGEEDDDEDNYAFKEGDYEEDFTYSIDDPSYFSRRGDSL